MIRDFAKKKRGYGSKEQIEFLPSVNLVFNSVYSIGIGTNKSPGLIFVSYSFKNAHNTLYCDVDNILIIDV